MVLHCGEQNGRDGLLGANTAGLPHLGHFTIGGLRAATIFIRNGFYRSLKVAQRELEVNGAVKGFRPQIAVLGGKTNPQ